MKKKIAIAAGDPAGIGPEVRIKAALDPAVRRACAPIVVGDAVVLMEAFPLMIQPAGDSNPIIAFESSIWACAVTEKAASTDNKCEIQVMSFMRTLGIQTVLLHVQRSHLSG